MRLVTFSICEQLYGLPLLIAGEFCTSIQITPFDAGDPRLRGITHIRGGSAVVIDLRQMHPSQLPDRLHESSAETGDDFIYINSNFQLCEEAVRQGLSTFDEPSVLLVDELVGIREFDIDDLHPTPAHLRTEYIDGIFEVESGDLIFLNYSRLIGSILKYVEQPI